jgi:hypothetical protein
VFENPLAGIRDEVAKMPELKQPRAGWKEALVAFRDRFARTLQILREEPEILAFAVAQWFVILLGGVLWLSMLLLLPQDNPIESKEELVTGIGFVITALVVGGLWTLAVIILVALPVGVLSAAMGAAHLLRRSGEPSTASRCLSIAWAQMRNLWLYHAIDGYVTVNAVLSRFPKKNGNRSKLEMIAEELLYFAWKLACIGVLPAMICGHGLVESGKRSLGFVKAKLASLMILRAGYGGLCWAVGSTAYFLSFAIMFQFGADLVKWFGADSSWALTFVAFGLPILGTFAITLVVFQPIYILTVCDLYADHLAETGERLSLAGDMKPLDRPLDLGFAGYAVIAVLAMVAAYQFGMADLISGFMRGAA